MSTWTQNMILTVLLLLLAAWMARTGSEEGIKQAGLVAAGILLLWRHSGRQPPDPPAPIPVALLALLAFGCGAPADVCVGLHAQRSAPRAQGGIGADHIQLTPQASNPVASTFAGIYAKSSDDLLRFVDTAGNERVAGEAWLARQSTGTPSPVAEGDLWYDPSLHRYRYRDNSGSMDFAASGSPAAHASTHLPGGSDALTVAAPGNVGTSNAAGSAASFSRSDHTHALSFSTVNTILGGASASIGVNSQKIAGLAQGTASGEAVAAQRSISTSAPLSGGGDLTANRTLSLSYSSSDFDVSGGALITKPGALVYQAVSGGGTGALGAATVYLGATNVAHTTTEYPQAVAARAGTARNLRCYLGTAPGGSDTVAVTARIAAADSALTCTITGAAQTCADTTHAPTVAAGDRLSTKAVSSAGTAASLVCSWEVGN